MTRQYFGLLIIHFPFKLFPGEKLKSVKFGYGGCEATETNTHSATNANSKNPQILIFPIDLRIRIKLANQFRSVLLYEKNSWNITAFINCTCETKYFT